jgi:hypothetical protein
MGATGDEPHYLAAHSLPVTDLDLANNYAQNDQWPFYPHVTSTCVGRTAGAPVHDLFAAPDRARVRWAWRAGVTAFFAIIAALVAVNVPSPSRLPGSSVAGHVAGDDATPLLVYAYRVYPEMIGAAGRGACGTLRFTPLLSCWKVPLAIGFALALREFIPIAAFLVLWARGAGTAMAPSGARSAFR